MRRSRCFAAAFVCGDHSRTQHLTHARTHAELLVDSATKLGAGEFAEIFPLIFTYRSWNSPAKPGHMSEDGGKSCAALRVVLSYAAGCAAFFLSWAGRPWWFLFCLSPESARAQTIPPTLSLAHARTRTHARTGGEERVSKEDRKRLKEKYGNTTFADVVDFLEGLPRDILLVMKVCFSAFFCVYCVRHLPVCGACVCLCLFAVCALCLPWSCCSTHLCLF